MMIRLKEKIISMDSKKIKRITQYIIAYCLFLIVCVIFTTITKKFEIACDIMRYIGIIVMIVWMAFLSIRRKSKDIIMRNNIINIILSDSKTVFVYCYLIVITILHHIKFEISSVILVILAIIIVIAIEIISDNISQYFNKKLK